MLCVADGSSIVPVETVSPQQFVAMPVWRSMETPSTLRMTGATSTTSVLRPNCQNALCSRWASGTLPGMPRTMRVLRTRWSVSLSNRTAPLSFHTRRTETPVPSETAVVFWSRGVTARRS